MSPARQLACWAFMVAMGGASGCGATGSSGSTLNGGTSNERHYASTMTAEQHAAEHRATAPALRDFEDAACRNTPIATRTECPLLGNVVAADDYEDGILIHLSLHAHPGEVIARARCHMAFGHAHAHGADNYKCPLYVDGVTLRRAEDVRMLELTATDPAKLDELRSRAHDHAGW